MTYAYDIDLCRFAMVHIHHDPDGATTQVVLSWSEEKLFSPLRYTET